MICLIKCLLDDAAYLFIYLTCCLLAIVALFPEITSQENQLFFMPQSHRSNATAHTILSHHRTGYLGHALNIVRGSGCHLTEDDQLCHVSPEGVGQHIFELRLTP